MKSVIMAIGDYDNNNNDN